MVARARPRPATTHEEAVTSYRLSADAQLSLSADAVRRGLDGFVLTVRPLDDPDVVRMDAEVQGEYLQIYGGQDRSPMSPVEFAAPNGVFLVGSLRGDPVATGGWRRRSDGSAEVKRMYVAARARRLGLARLVLAELERTAAAAGATRMVLSTGNKQPEAVALYRQRSYEPVPGWGVYAGDPCEVFLGKLLTPGA